MKKFVLFLLLMLPLSLLAQGEVVTIYPQEEPTGKSFTAISASSYSTFTFKYPGVGHRTSYGGYATICIDVDSAAGTVGDRDSLWASVKPTFWSPPRAGTSDALIGTWRRSGEADQDSTAIVSVYNWGTTDSDNYFDITLVYNVMASDGAIITIYTGLNGQCKVRPFIKIAKPVGL